MHTKHSGSVTNGLTYRAKWEKHLSFEAPCFRIKFKAFSEAGYSELTNFTSL